MTRARNGDYLDRTFHEAGSKVFQKFQLKHIKCKNILRVEGMASITISSLCVDGSLFYQYSGTVQTLEIRERRAVDCRI